MEPLSVSVCVCVVCVCVVCMSVCVCVCCVHLRGDSMLPARGTERPEAAKSRANTSNLALVLQQGGEREIERLRMYSR